MSVSTRPFYIIFSSRTLENLGTLIEDYYSKIDAKDLKDFCLLVPDKFKNQPTLRTIVVLDERVYELLKEKENEIDEFKIEKLQLKKHFYPNQDKAETKNFYIPLPMNLPLSACQQHLIERMTSLREYGIWNKKDYNIYIPKMDRIKDTHKGTAYIYFNEVPEDRLDDIVLSRLFINNTKWPGKNQEVHCFWTRNMSPKTGDKQETKTDNKESSNVWDQKKGKHY